MVGYPHPIKGQGIYAYVTLMAGETPDESLRKELVQWVRKEIGAIASPDLIQFAPGLPKTRSGKIMRRILRKIAEDDFSNLGDTSTLADPAVVDDLVNNRQNKAVQRVGRVGRNSPLQGVFRRSLATVARGTAEYALKRAIPPYPRGEVGPNLREAPRNVLKSR